MSATTGPTLETRENRIYPMLADAVPLAKAVEHKKRLDRMNTTVCVTIPVMSENFTGVAG